MEPALKPGQEILVSSLPYLILNPKVGDLVAFKDKNKFIIKRIKKAGKDEFLVKGDNLTDSKDYGWIKKNNIIGKVIYVYA